MRDYLLDESCVATWMVSNVHITMMNGIITCNAQFKHIKMSLIHFRRMMNVFLSIISLNYTITHQ